MKNDLSSFEKDLLRSINFTYGKNYNYKHLAEWNSNKTQVEKNLQEGEILYKALGVYVAINPSGVK